MSTSAATGPIDLLENKLGIDFSINRETKNIHNSSADKLFDGTTLDPHSAGGTGLTKYYPRDFDIDGIDIQFDFGITSSRFAGIGTKISGVQMSTAADDPTIDPIPDRDPTGWLLEGSNDLTIMKTWTSIHSESGLTPPLARNMNYEATIFPTSETYRYFRFRVTSTTFAALDAQLSSLRFFGVPIVVSFNSSGGSEVAPLTYTGDPLTEPTTTYAGSTFVGWFDSNNDPYDWSTEPTEAVTLNAKWRIPCGTGTYDVKLGVANNGGSCTGAVILDPIVNQIENLGFKNSNLITSVTFPASVTRIGSEAFSGASLLAHVIFDSGSNLNEIGDDSFLGTALQSITIPSSVTNIGGRAFAGVAALTAVTFESGSHLLTIGPTAFSGTSIVSVSFPASLTTIQQEAFMGTTSLISATFPIDSNLTSIGFEAFESTKLTSVNIPNRVTTIYQSAFRNCDLLQTVIIGSGVTDIFDEAFGGATSLRSVVIPNNVRNIGPNVFPKELLAQNNGLTLHLAVGGSYEYKFITCQGANEFCDMKNSGVFRANAPIGMTWSPDGVGVANNIVSGTPTTVGGSISALDTSYFVNWIVEASVTFNANGGSGSMNVETGTATTSLSSNTFTRTGYTFSGWATSTGGAVVYADHADYAFTSDLNLFAKWTLNSAPVVAVVIPDPPQTSKVISAISEVNENSNGEEIIVLGDFIAPISNIAINGKALNSADWKQGSSKLVIKYVTKLSSKLLIQIWNGQAPVLSAIDVVINVKKVEPVAKPAETPVATPVITPTPKPIAETGVKKAVVKKKTLVCYKGKKSKKVKAVKPNCPKGYKVKKLK